MHMRTLTGFVENGTVRLPPDARVRDGSRVLMVVLGRKGSQVASPRDSRVAAEDAVFVNTCRRSIGEATRTEES